MDEDRAFAAISNTVRLEGLTRNAVRKSTPALKRAYEQLIQAILDLPDGSVEREFVYKQLEALQRIAFVPPAMEFTAELEATMAAEAPRQVQFASRYLGPAFADRFLTFANEPVDDVMTQMALNAMDRTKVLDKSINQLFEPLSRSQWKRVDKVVRQGFLEGLSSKQIARKISKTYRNAKVDYNALARTALFEMAQQASLEFYDAHSDVIVEWIFDATMDYKVCERCAPLNVQRSKDRSDFRYGYDPSRGEFATRVHPNCRCFIRPITEGMKQIEEEDGGGDRDMMVLIPREGTDDYKRFQDMVKNAEDVRYFKSPVYVNVLRKRQKRYQAALTFAPDGKEAMSMADMLARTTHEMQAQVLGSYKKGAEFVKVSATP